MVNSVCSVFVLLAGGVLQLVRHLMNLESVQSRDESVASLLGSVLRVHHEQHVRKARAKVASVGVMVPRAFRRVHFVTFRAVKFYHGLAGHVGKSDGQEWIVFTVNATAVSKVYILPFFYHLRNSSVG